MWDTSGGMNRGAICMQHKWQVTFPFTLFVNIIAISYTLRSWRRDRLKCLTIPSPWWSSVGRGLGYQISEKPNNCGNHKWKKHQNCPHESTATPQCSKLYLISRGRITYSENGMLPQLTTCTYPLPHQSCQDIIHRDSGVHLIVFNFKA